MSSTNNGSARTPAGSAPKDDAVGDSGVRKRRLDPALVGAVMVLAAASLWASLGLFSRALYDHGLTPLELASVRSAVGFAGLAAWVAATRRRISIPRRELPFFAAFGLASIAVFQLLYFATIQRTAIAIAAALLYTAPAFVVVLARLTLGEPLTRPRLIALTLVLAGVVLVTGALGAAAAGAAPVTAGAVALGLGAGLTYALYTLFGKYALRRHDPVRTVFFAFLFGALFLGLAVPPWRPMLAHPDALPLLLGLGLLPTLAAYLLYIAGLSRLTAGTSSLLASAEPVVAALLGAAFLGERLGGGQLAGVALIVGAAVLLSLRRT